MDRPQKEPPSSRRAIYRDQLVTLGDLQQFQEELLQAIRRMLAEKSGAPQTGRSWVKTQQVCKLLGCSPGTLLNLRANGTLPFTKIGGTIFYNADEINKVLQDRRQHFQRNSVPLRGAKKA